MRKIILIYTILCPIFAFSQYADYIGAGHADNVTVTASSQQTRTDWNETAFSVNTVNGQGLDSRLLETSRFLAQTTFGTNLEYIQDVSESTYEDWIEEQFTFNSVPMRELIDDVYQEALQLWIENGGNPDDYDEVKEVHFLYTWWHINMNNDDLFKQRIALALSEILVISMDSDLGTFGDGLASYYDVLINNSFGNFHDLLLEVSLHPMMGHYLSHYNNPKSNPNENVHPDENYAREIMQLFSIGLNELNTDGSYLLDGEGQRIPTYDNNDIKEFAKVFTGLGPAEVIENPYGVIPEFGVDFWFCDKSVPMIVYNEWHEPGEKHLLNGYTIPAGQTGIQDIEDAVNHLFNHPNVGPFIAKRLIQRLVKSNPSPQYIFNVASAFNDTEGVRGDMRAVIKAILLDEEARSCTWVNNPHQGKLREPMLRYFNVARQIDIDNPLGNDWNIGYSFYDFSGQAPLAAPSVFNFFLPEFEPNGLISDAGLVAPEFQIHNSYTSVAYVNHVDYWTYIDSYPIYEVWEIDWEDNAKLNFDALKYWAKEPEVLINYLDKLFTHGLLSNETRIIIKDAITPIQGDDTNIDYMHYRVKLALYLLLISPDYAIIK